VTFEPTADALRDAVMQHCLDLSREAMAIFDAVEAGRATMATARAVVLMGQHANDVALGVRTLVITGNL
jgi:hypothetical protein